jgi:hypothetical protein
VPSKVPTYRPTWMKPVTPRPRENTEWRQFINSPAWRRCSKSFLASHPLCSDCQTRNRLVAATQTHHTRGDDMEFAFDESTFVALCRECHSRITRGDMNRSRSN